jgi:tRNA (guanine-N7-)-methyltransferase
MSEPAAIETEFGVPIPGRILPEAEWARTAFKQWPTSGRLDWDNIFGRTAPIVMELGCGNGRFTLLSALARPELNHFASDSLPVVIRYATRRANQRGLHNTRFAVRDARTLLRDFVREGSVSEIHIYHPQPYHDPAQAHLRLLTPEFLADVHGAIAPSGLFVVQTDNPDYWAYLKGVLPEFFVVCERDAPWPDAPEGRSRREILARSRGLTIYRGEMRRREDINRREARAKSMNLPRPTFHSSGPWADLDAWETGRGSR